MALRFQKVMMLFEGVPELPAFDARARCRPRRELVLGLHTGHAEHPRVLSKKEEVHVLGMQ